MSELGRVLIGALGRFTGKKKPGKRLGRRRRGQMTEASEADESTIYVASLLDRFIGEKFTLGEVIDVRVPEDCTWTDELDDGTVCLKFTNEPILNVDVKWGWFKANVDVYLSRLNVQVTHLDLFLTRMGIQRTERVDIDWSGP